MKPQQPQITIKKLIISTKGQHEPQNPSTLLVLPHQPLHPNPSKTGTKPLTLETLSFHRKHPLSLQNTSVTPTLIDHEIHTKLGATQKNGGKDMDTTRVMVVDSSAWGVGEKTAEVFRKYTVVRGYLYTLPSALLNSTLTQMTKQTQVLISPQNISKELGYTFGILGDQCRGFIGQVDVPYHMEMIEKLKFYNQAITNVIKCYGEFSTTTECPVFVNLLKFGSQGYGFEKGEDGLGKCVEFLLSRIPASAYKNVLLINPHILIQSTHNGQTIVYQNKSSQKIKELYKLGFTLVFDLARYRNQMPLIWIAQYLIEWPSQTIISSGLQFKTDFVQFGGEGLTMEDSLKTISTVLGSRYQQLMAKAQRDNILRLLTWYQKKIIKVQVKMWKCVQCGKQSPQTEQAFRKFKKDFCSIECLRAHKF